MRKVRLFAVTGLLLLLALLSPGLVAAFSAYGVGTSGSPYRVATCAQLQEMTNNLAGYYKLVSNIDCTGTVFTSVGAYTTPFTGNLDGDNHTISNLSVSTSGLFAYTAGATIRNLTISSGTSTGNGNQGSFVGYAINSTLSNVHSSMAIAVLDPSSAAYIGGLVGAATGATSIDSSSYSGTMAGGAYVGGLVGYMGNLSTPTSDVLSNSLFNGTINLAGIYAGGAVGILYSGTVSNVYSSGTINVTGATSYVGGLIGISYRGASNNNFSATYINGTGTSIGGIYGTFFVTTNGWNSTRSNDYYDRYRANGNDAYSRNCAADEEGSGNCTAVNTANATPSYFKNNTTNAPLNHASWNFTTTWQTTASYPTLRNISNFTDQTVPNGGDANGDGTNDSFQAWVASTQSSSSIWSTVEVPSSSSCTTSNPVSVDIASLKSDSGYTSQLSTMMSFDIYCPVAGRTVPVTIIYDKQYDTRNSVLRHYNSTTNTYTTVAGAVFGTRTVGGVVKTTVTYSITDGGSLDTDGISNGIIKDPVGLSLLPASPNTGLHSQDSRIIYALTLAGIFTIAGALYGRRKNYK